ncbi:HAMP domain-containing histidine kinase [Photobacterium sp. ZSDE20]|uniref:histidine kinase n=1 Tax=Photobacterium pectinilyticum TaxID=2906793 RepID=A0ABT1N253_9GAMM|nr:HAMP domain-containing sensor histidine kinase [Photobacterium sp. ZSDE20]MCQ1058622.1 HAMP domain-containing histidine kinase [Photobacterium sp. ZSDE20]MDD1824058.1 HAMP domain-containing histidine kinase [Photobacterium sp. ZSDE20]
MNFKTKLVLLTGCWFLLSIVVIGGMFNYQQTYVEQRTQQNLHRELAAHMRDDSPLMDDSDYNPKALKSIFHTLMLLGPDFEIYFLDNDGNIKSHAAPEGIAISQQVNLKPIRAFLADKPFPILGDDPRNAIRQKVFSVAPIKEGNTTNGYLYVVIGSEQRALAAKLSDMDSLQQSPIVWVTSAALILVLGFSLTVYRLTKTTLLNPIRQVTQDLKTQAENGYRLKPEAMLNVAELKPIAKQMYLMARTISQQFLQLEQQEQKRRELLVQLSHDLKTPLASVLGYLETWQIQATKPDPLINTAQRNALKLSELLTQQIKIARQQSVLSEPKFEALKLGHILQDVIDTMQPEANKKKVELTLNIPKQDVVFGDKQLLQRLFTNLFDNAIRHAPYASTVQLMINPEPIGLGISMENDIDPQAPQGTMGLGTKIIQSILMLHQSQLRTKQGQQHFEQSFSLPLPT